MPTPIEVKRLAATDVGKTITAAGRQPATIKAITHTADHTTVTVDAAREAGGRRTMHFEHHHKVTITGQPSPACTCAQYALQLANQEPGPATPECPHHGSGLPHGSTPTPPRPEICAHNGGLGIGAGHRCLCIRPAGHPLDNPRPHGCSCMALWADTPTR